MPTNSVGPEIRNILFATDQNAINTFDPDISTLDSNATFHIEGDTDTLYAKMFFDKDVRYNTAIANYDFDNANHKD